MMLPQAYTNLSIFKRIEVWILLVLTVAGITYVLLSNDGSGGARRSGDPEPEPRRPVTHQQGPPEATRGSAFNEDGPLAIKRVTVKREGEHYLTEVAFSYDNQSDTVIRTAERAKLITRVGKMIPIFFLAFTGAPPLLPAMEKTETTMHFSILGEDIVGELGMVIDSHRVPIKSAHSFDPESIGDGQSVTFNNLDW